MTAFDPATLKPCPFCGSSPQRITKGASKGRVRCNGIRKDGVTWPIETWQQRAEQ